jgi:hypothetical protein
MWCVAEIPSDSQVRRAQTKSRSHYQLVVKLDEFRIMTCWSALCLISPKQKANPQGCWAALNIPKTSPSQDNDLLISSLPHLPKTKGKSTRVLSSIEHPQNQPQSPNPNDPNLAPCSLMQQRNLASRRSSVASIYFWREEERQAG